MQGVYNAGEWFKTDSPKKLARKKLARKSISRYQPALYKYNPKTYQAAMHYETFSVQDFIQDDFFIQSVITPDALSMSFWAHWLETHPDRAADFEKAKAYVLNLHAAEAQSHPSNVVDKAVTEVWQNIEASLATPVLPPRPSFFTWKSGYAWGLGLVLIMGAWLLWGTLIRQSEQAQPQTTWVEHATNAHERIRLTLEDGTKVLLEPNSRLEIAQDFGKKNRTVRLLGSGFFEVAKNQQKPFLVYTEETITRVLGTSFWVRAPKVAGKVQTVRVDVRTGRVEVARLPQTKPVSAAAIPALVLKPNQQATFDLARINWEVSLSDAPEVLPEAQKTTSFTFIETPVEQVLAALSKAYGIDVIASPTAIKGCKVTLSLDDLSLFEKLKIITTTINATYIEENAQILISGSGCQP